MSLLVYHLFHMPIFFLRRNRSSASDFAYCYPFDVAWTVVCHWRTCAPCLNRWTDLHAICQVHLRGPMADGGPWPQRERGIWVVELPSLKLHLPILMIHQGQHRSAISLIVEWLCGAIYSNGWTGCRRDRPIVDATV